MAATLTRGAIGKIKGGDFNDAVTFKVSSMDKDAKGKYKLVLIDGSDSIDARLNSQLTPQADAGDIAKGCVIKVTDYISNRINDTILLMISDLEVVLSPSSDDASAPLHNQENHQAISNKQAKTHPGATPSERAQGQKVPNVSPLPVKTPFTPATNLRGPSNVTPLTSPANGAAGSLSVAPEKKTTHKLEQIHPYDDQWCIKVKVTRKGPIWQLNNNKTPNGSASIPKFTLEMVDASGKQIQGTFWRAQAEKYHELIQEGKVYVISRFQVKVANKAYSSVNNDYEIHFSDKTEVMEASEQDQSLAMTASVQITPIEQLLKHVQRKAPVDVCGVVVAVGALGTIKRKNDNTEVQRREVTLVDGCGKTVGLTLWGDLATSHEADEMESRHLDRCVVLQCTSCRVTEYNGCSLSTLSKSVLTIDPEPSSADPSDPVAGLKSWWEAQGYEGASSASAAAFPPVGGGGASGASGPEGGSGGKGQGGGGGKVGSLAEVAVAAKASNLPPPEAKATYVEVRASASVIKADQNLWYLAHPETGRKVTQQGDGSYYCEHDGSTVLNPQHRYVFQFKMVDFSGEAWANVFASEAELLLGANADKMAEYKANEDDAAFAARVKAAQWTEWNMVVASRTRDYNGERKMRHTVQSLKPVDYVKDCRRLLDAIKLY